MEGNFPTSTYNRKSGIVVKKTNTMDCYRDRPVLIQSGKKSTSTNNRTSPYDRNLKVRLITLTS